jgi:hypothetical protein
MTKNSGWSKTTTWMFWIGVAMMIGSLIGLAGAMGFQLTKMM